MGGWSNPAPHCPAPIIAHLCIMFNRKFSAISSSVAFVAAFVLWLSDPAELLAIVAMVFTALALAIEIYQQYASRR